VIASLPAEKFRVIVKYALILSAIFLAASCSRKPAKEDCARYDRHLAELAAHPAIEAALRSAGGRDAATAHCMELKKSQVECSTEATSLSDAAACESKKGSFFDF
jgi:cobalamin biosynthesis protein CobD/CbiB